MDVRVDAARGQDAAFAGKNLGGCADFHAGSNAIHDAGISGFADCGNLAVANRDVGFVDSGVVQNQRVGDHQIGGAAGPRRFGGLAHAVADDFAAAELHFIAINGPIGFHFDDQVGVSKPNAVAGGRAVVIGVVSPIDFHFQFSINQTVDTIHRARSAQSDQFDFFVSPGSKRTAVPAGILSRMP